MYEIIRCIGQPLKVRCRLNPCNKTEEKNKRVAKHMRFGHSATVAAYSSIAQPHKYTRYTRVIAFGNLIKKKLYCVFFSFLLSTKTSTAEYRSAQMVMCNLINGYIAKRKEIYIYRTY